MLCETTATQPGAQPEQLVCTLEDGHDGPHYDAAGHIEWDLTIADCTTNPRHHQEAAHAQ